jgi:hypothetical protein
VNDSTVINIFVYLGGIFIKRKTQTAVQILAFAESLARSSAVHRDPIFDKPYFDRYISAARAKLSEVEFTSAWEAGSKMTVDEAIEFALKAMEEIQG